MYVLIQMYKCFKLDLIKYLANHSKVYVILVNPFTGGPRGAGANGREI